MRSAADLIVERPEGLYCPPGDFYIDPWRPVARAVVTHAHADHARPGHGAYLAAAPAAGVLRARLGDIALQTLAYGEPIDHFGVRLSLHPAGHVLGSAQVRLEHRGQVWVASGDYFVSGAGDGEVNPTCAPFEPVRCHCFITESTFGLPIYRWRPQHELFAEVDAWWRGNVAAGRPSLLMGYSFGKAQRLLAGVDPSIGPIVVHGAVDTLNRAYRAAGVALPPTLRVAEVDDKALLRTALVLAPPSVAGSAWARRFPGASDAFASGWMQLRGARRRRGVDRGFVLSDHADWPGLQRAIGATGCERVIVTHGYEAVMVRWLQEQGLEAGAFRTEYGDEALDAEGHEAAEPAQAAGRRRGGVAPAAGEARDPDADRDAARGAGTEAPADAAMRGATDVPAEARAGAVGDRAVSDSAVSDASISDRPASDATRFEPTASDGGAPDRGISDAPTSHTRGSDPTAPGPTAARPRRGAR